MNNSQKKVIPLPTHLKHHYVASHQLTDNYISGMKAIEANRLEDAIEILEAEAQDSPCRGLAVGNAGQALLRLERFELAQKRLLEADDHFKQHGCPHPPSWVQVARNYGEVIVHCRPQEALQRFNCAIHFARELAKTHPEFESDIELQMAHTFNSWGATLMKLHSPHPAIDCYQSARDIYRKYESSNKVGLAETLTNFALALSSDNNKTDAGLALQEALDVAKLGGDHNQIRRIEIAMIQLDPELVNEDPLELLKAAAEEAVAEGRFSTGYLRHCIRATVAKSLGKLEEGLQACNDALAIESRLDSRDLSPAELRLTFASLLELKGNDKAQMLNVLFEGAKLWWDHLGKDQLLADLLAKTQSMHNHFRSLARKLIDSDRADEACMVFESGRALGFGLEVDKTALLRVLELAPFTSSNNSAECAGLKKSQSALLENEVIISLAILPPDLVAFVVRRDSVITVTHPLPDENGSIQLLNSIRQISPKLYKNGGLLAIPQDIQDFGKKIVAEIQLSSSIVSLIPNSLLHYVPWRTLLRSLGVNWSKLQTDTKFGLFVGNGERGIISKMAISLGHGTAGSLDLNQEARDFALAFGALGAVIENATSSDIRRALHRPGIVHVSCHGTQSEDRNTRRRHLYLLLQDGEKSAEEVIADGVNADCVVLSACDSGVYEVAWSDYPVGAGPDLLRKGAKLCLATRFPVNAKFAAALMKTFAKHAASGESIQTALGKSLQTLETNGADFWNEIACFELIGR